MSAAPGAMAPDREEALSPASEDPGFHAARARASQARGDLDGAVRAFGRAVRLDDGDPQTRVELGLALRHQGRFAEAVEELEHAVRLAPRSGTARQHLAETWFRMGEFGRGAADYEWRLAGQPPAPFTQPLWDGSPLRGRTILMYGEGGLGDHLQFVRYAPLLRERGGRVVVSTSNLLARLLRTCDGVEEVCFSYDAIPAFDVYAYMFSLPGLLGTGPETIPAAVPYLRADPERTARWREFLGRFGDDLRVGINWEGKRYQVDADRDRNVPLRCFHPLARVPGVQLFSLQKGPGREQLAEAPDDVRVVDLGQHFGEMASTAAAIEALDLVVTNDTSVAHVAGALGKPVWVVLPRHSCWRWMHGREDSPWYPTLRLFRRGWTEEWDDVFGRVRDALADAAERRERVAR